MRARRPQTRPRVTCHPISAPEIPGQRPFERACGNADLADAGAGAVLVGLEADGAGVVEFAGQHLGSGGQAKLGEVAAAGRPQSQPDRLPSTVRHVGNGWNGREAAHSTRSRSDRTSTGVLAYA